MWQLILELETNTIIRLVTVHHKRGIFTIVVPYDNCRASGITATAVQSFDWIIFKPSLPVVVVRRPCVSFQSLSVICPCGHSSCPHLLDIGPPRAGHVLPLGPLGLESTLSAPKLSGSEWICGSCSFAYVTSSLRICCAGWDSLSSLFASLGYIGYQVVVFVIA